MKKILTIIVIGLFISIQFVFADSVGTPVKVFLSHQDLATLAIPRWKGYVSPTNQNELWFTFANWGTPSSHLVYSTDGGSTWISGNYTIPDNLTCDYHLSIAGDNSSNIYAVTPEGNSILFRKINYPGHSSSDLDPLRTLLTVSGSNPRANVMVEPNNQRIWVFTRASGIPTQNVRYQYSDNGGLNWTGGVADPTFADEVRIGSMPYVDGRPALVVAYMSSSPPQGYRYFLWNGSSFVAEPDSYIYNGPLGLNRAFTHNVTSGNYFHLIFGLGTDLYHYWKQWNNGTGNWNSEIIDSSPYNTGSIDWEVSSTVRGPELYVFYTKNVSSSASSSEVYYKKWTENTQSWSAPVVLSTHPENTNNHHPNTVMKVPVAYNYIPVFWYSDLGPADKQIYYNKILVDSTMVDSTVSRLDIDLKIKEFKDGTATQQDVLDLIQQYNNDSTK